MPYKWIWEHIDYMKEQWFSCRGGNALTIIMKCDLSSSLQTDFNISLQDKTANFKPKHVKEERREISIFACSMSQSLDDS